ncbi:MAG: ABC transporter permease [Thermoplasmata archaeon]|nr:ABC transporter permease [Thermoplasmata archaeon]
MAPARPASALGSRIGRAAAVVAAISLGALIVVPVLALVTYSPFGSLAGAVQDRGFRDAVVFTLEASGLAVAAALLLGVPSGYLLARRNFRGKSIVEALVTLPILIPHLLVGVALVVLFDRETLFGSVVVRLGIPFLNTIYAVVAVMTYVSVSYAVTASQLAFQTVDPDLLEASRTLGASPATAFRTITLPIAVRGIVTGGVLAWGRSVSEVGGLLIVAYTVYPVGPWAGPITSPASVYLYNLYTIGGLPGAAPAATIFILLGFAIFVTVRLLERLGRVVWRRQEFLP